MSLCVELVWSVVTLEGKDSGSCKWLVHSPNIYILSRQMHSGTGMAGSSSLYSVSSNVLVFSVACYWRKSVSLPFCFWSTGQYQGELPSGMASLCLHRELLKSKTKPPPSTQKNSLAFLTLIQKATPFLPSLYLVSNSEAIPDPCLVIVVKRDLFLETEAWSWIYCWLTALFSIKEHRHHLGGCQLWYLTASRPQGQEPEAEGSHDPGAAVERGQSHPAVW